MKVSNILTTALLLSTSNAIAVPIADADADAKKPTTTVTVTHSGPTTHKYGKFNNTHHETTKTTSTGTHKYGKFNNTHHDVTTTTIYEGDAAHAITNPFTMKNSVVGWSVGAVGCAAAALLL